MKKNAAVKKNNAYKLAPKMPEGTEVVDVLKSSWKIGPSIGSGGFGLIYLTQNGSISGMVSKNAEQVMKLEPKSNGPLFCEQAFFQRTSKPENAMTDFMKRRGIKSLGFPKFHTFGLFDYKEGKYRFLILQRFKVDLQKLFEASGKKFPLGTVFQVALQVLDILEYIHGHGYAHADIKAANLMIGIKDPNQVYLIDYGLASKFTVDGKHKEYKEDPKKAHDGTAEFASRDAHKGLWPSARGDLEILGYCMWQWLTGRLPWEGDLDNKALVTSQKVKYMGNIKGLVAPLIKDKTSSKSLCAYLTEVNKLEYDEEPNYNSLRNLLQSALKDLKVKLTDKLEFISQSGEPDIKSPVKKRITTSGDTKGAAERLKSPMKQSPSKVQRTTSKSPGRNAGGQKLLSPALQSKLRVATNKENKEQISKTPLLDAYQKNPNKQPHPGSGTRKRKRAEEDLEDDSTRPKRTATVTEEAPSNPSRLSRATSTNKPQRIKTLKVSSSTQTSPGMRGLPRSRGAREVH